MSEATPEFKHVHPSLVKALKLDNESWKIGDPAVVVHTKSGSLYCITSEGAITGGSHIGSEQLAELWGGVYRRSGPIRIGQIVVGLGMEIGVLGEECVLTTSPVVKTEVQE